MLVVVLLPVVVLVVAPVLLLVLVVVLLMVVVLLLPPPPPPPPLSLQCSEKRRLDFEKSHWIGRKDRAKLEGDCDDAYRLHAPGMKVRMMLVLVLLLLLLVLLVLLLVLILIAPGCSWLLLVAPGCSWLLLVAPGCSWLLLVRLVLLRLLVLTSRARGMKVPLFGVNYDDPQLLGLAGTMGVKYEGPLEWKVHTDPCCAFFK